MDVSKGQDSGSSKKRKREGGAEHEERQRKTKSTLRGQKAVQGSKAGSGTVEDSPPLAIRAAGKSKKRKITLDEEAQLKDMLQNEPSRTTTSQAIDASSSSQAKAGAAATSKKSGHRTERRRQSRQKRAEARKAARDPAPTITHSEIPEAKSGQQARADIRDSGRVPNPETRDQESSPEPADEATADAKPAESPKEDNVQPAQDQSRSNGILGELQDGQPAKVQSAKKGVRAEKRRRRKERKEAQGPAIEPSTRMVSKRLEQQKPSQRVSGPITDLSASAPVLKAGKRRQKVQQEKKQNTQTQAHHGHGLSTDHLEVRKQQKPKGQTATKSTALICKDGNEDAVQPAENQHSTLVWTLSNASAGRFLNQDPVFVRDEDGQRFLIAANDREVQLLSLESSLVIHNLSAPIGQSVSCFTVNGIDDRIVHVLLSNGDVVLWNWMEDIQANGSFAAPGNVKAFTSAPSSDDSSSVYYISNLGAQHRVFNEAKRLHTSEEPLEDVKVLANGAYVVCRGPSALVLGMKTDSGDAVATYTWLEVPLSSSSTCFDARLRANEASSTKKSKQTPGLSLAIGNETGQIHLYDDVSSLFKQKEQQTLPSPRILHWHREAVSSVKFSRNGNYLISGGKETVLVIWQLETGKKQFLPHLTSKIERIVVSPEDDRYALQMGDNSIMVLSTSELKPVANFAGLQTPVQSVLPRKGKYRPSAAILHPRHPSQLLVTVPSSQPKTNQEIPTRPFLQTFDTRNSRHANRQALTRNNVTDFNLGPEQTPIVPPDVTHLAVSQDGLWLATVDEWTPPASDVEHLASNKLDIQAEQERRREIYLKIWQWNVEQGLWTLSTRFDAPHARANGEKMGAGEVLALVSDPVSNAFATIGEDSCVNIWKPKTRIRHGVSIKNQQDVELVEWVCKRTVHLPGSPERADSPMDVPQKSTREHTCLAYAEDGSMLAVSQALELGMAHFIDTATGNFISKPGLASEQITSIGFLGRHFIAVCRSATYVWDLVSDTLLYKVRNSKRPRGNGSELAVNTQDGTFAVHTPTESGSSVQVYKAAQSRRLYKEKLGVEVETILSGRGVKGFMLLFADATIRTLSPPSGISARALPGTQPPMGLPAPETPLAIGPPAADDVDVDMADILAEPRDRQAIRLVMNEGDDRPVVRPEQLAQIFDVGQSFAMPPVKDMFQAVVGLYGRKPESRTEVAVA